jgi:hypothetical protein
MQAEPTHADELCPLLLISQHLVSGVQMDQIKPASDFVLSYWNDFAQQNGYEKLHKHNEAIRRKVRSRIYSEPDFLQKLPYYFDIIHKNCAGKNEFGNKLNLINFLRATTIHRALLKEKAEVNNG